MRRFAGQYVDVEHTTSILDIGLLENVERKADERWVMGEIS
jgi:hypothetical protein